MRNGEPPAAYLARLKVRFNDTKGVIDAIVNMMYPADPLVEPELMGLTYYQVGILRQAQKMTDKYGWGTLQILEFFTDRLIGRPAQTNVNLNVSESYDMFLEKIVKAEEKIIDVGPDQSQEDLARDLGL
jgi:hypothetical protein